MLVFPLFFKNASTHQRECFPGIDGEGRQTFGDQCFGDTSFLCVWKILLVALGQGCSCPESWRQQADCVHGCGHGGIKKWMGRGLPGRTDLGLSSISDISKATNRADGLSTSLQFYPRNCRITGRRGRGGGISPRVTARLTSPVP